eukprot:492710-Rhodomonas_salina.1
MEGAAEKRGSEDPVSRVLILQNAGQTRKSPCIVTIPCARSGASEETSQYHSKIALRKRCMKASRVLRTQTPESNPSPAHLLLAGLPSPKHHPAPISICHPAPPMPFAER